MKIFPLLFFLFFSLYGFLNIYNHQYKMVGNIFQVVMLFCLVYEHGFKIYYKNGRRKIFIVFYISPYFLVLYIFLRNDLQGFYR